MRDKSRKLPLFTIPAVLLTSGLLLLAFFLNSHPAAGASEALAGGPATTPLVQSTAANTTVNVTTGSTATLTPTPTAAQVTLEEPALTPAPGDQCKTGWLEFTNARGRPAYLALNVNDPALSTNQGEWHPTLPKDGVYKVEAYIPDHKSITWSCTGATIGWDTSDANYQIHYLWGLNSVSRDQAPVADNWIDLGSYPFSAGSKGFVALSDLTGEISRTKTVSFSAMRFTWQGQIPKRVFLPGVMKDFGTIKMDKAWTADASGKEIQAFTPGETLHYAMRGTNNTGKAATVALKITQVDPCGGKQEIKDTPSLPTGDWQLSKTTSLSYCFGVYSYTVEVDYQKVIDTREGEFVVNNPSGVVVSQKPAFDKCNVTTVPHMQTWWNESPYYTVNIYLGGIQRSCDNTELDAFWVQNVSQQGWSLIPTWVGPQAPCSKFAHRVSSNLAVAFSQGRSEADAALEAADRLGLEKDRVIYYDLEAYYGASQSCRDAMKSFLWGWTGRLHDLGARAGIYGSCYSYISDWATLTEPPDDVWMAHWTGQSYDPDATVWGVPCVSDNLWPNHQRIRQYGGGHVETWGGIALSVDSNALDGEVSMLPAFNSGGGSKQPETGAALLTAGSENKGDAGQAPVVQDMQLISAEQGWALVEGQLFWTQDGGSSWEKRQPPGAMQILKAAFLDEKNGWVIARSGVEAKPVALRTLDGGQTWQSAAAQPDSEALVGVASADLQFVDEKHGWAAFRLISSSNFSLGLLWSTQDGGVTWQASSLPVAGKIRFIDANRGWLAGGASGGELYFTQDGGQTWQVQSIVSPEREAQVGLPQFEDTLHGLLPVTFAKDDGGTLALFATQDGGESWSLSEQTALPEESAPGAAPQLQTIGKNAWILPGAGSKELLSAAPGGQARSLPKGTVAVQFAGASSGWARAEYGVCRGEKSGTGEPFACRMESQLLKTSDGGGTWTEVALPGQ